MRLIDTIKIGTLVVMFGNSHRMARVEKRRRSKNKKKPESLLKIYSEKVVRFGCLFEFFPFMFDHLHTSKWHERHLYIVDDKF